MLALIIRIREEERQLIKLNPYRVINLINFLL
jgi:hypothetical protein